MNKQKEIREGLITKIKSIRAWGGNPDDPLSPEDDVADILRYLDRKGVVIKVDKELPQNPNKALQIDIDKNSKKTWDVAHSYGWRDGWSTGRDDTIEAGYVATEPLVEE